MQAAEKDDLSASTRLFGELKNGSPAQNSKLGYAAFPYLMDDNKIPIFPVSPKRVGWKTFVRIDRNTFPDGAKILFSADINVHPDFLNGLSYVGEAKYISPAFGWLREEKEYSVEISALIGEHIDVLYRYTIGGSDRVKKYIEPKLLELSCEKA